MAPKHTQRRSTTKTTNFLSELKIEAPFYSLAMQAFRIECVWLDRTSSYRWSRASCIYAKAESDAWLVYETVKHMMTWSAWSGSSELIRAALVNGTGQRVWRVGIRGWECEEFHIDPNRHST